MKQHSPLDEENERLCICVPFIPVHPTITLLSDTKLAKGGNKTQKTFADIQVLHLRKSLHLILRKSLWTMHGRRGGIKDM